MGWMWSEQEGNIEKEKTKANLVGVQVWIFDDILSLKTSNGTYPTCSSMIKQKHGTIG